MKSYIIHFTKLPTDLVTGSATMTHRVLHQPFKHWSAEVVDHMILLSCVSVKVKCSGKKNLWIFDSKEKLSKL